MVRRLTLLATFVVISVVFFQLFFIDAAPTHHNRNRHNNKGSRAPVNRQKLSKKDQQAIRALYNRGMVEGDILVRRKPGSKPRPKVSAVDNDRSASNTNQFRNAVHSDEYTWPNGVIPYTIDGDLAGQTDLIQKAMSQIQRHTCIKFRPKTADDTFYIRLFKGQGCYASIGRDPDFPEGLVSLGDGCYYAGTVVHELMHTIGYYHEHNRHDRDDYLRIYPDNINPEDLEQFDINDRRNERIFTSFDYNSVMLYGPRAFSKDQHSITMEPKLAGFYMIEVHEKPGLTKLDAESIKKLYRCAA